jgi:outer membrane protein TolC
MTTITAEQVRDLAEKLVRAGGELSSAGHELATPFLEAAAQLEAAAGDPEAAEAAIAKLDERVKKSNLEAGPGGDRAITATRAGDGTTLEQTPEAVFFLNQLVRQISRSV